MIGLSNLKRRIQRLGYPERPRAERIAASGLAATYGVDSELASAVVKDISSTGIYLITEKRLRTGELITLKLQENDEAEQAEGHQVSIHAKVARLGEDGLGLSFVLPPGLDNVLWGVLVRNIVTLTQKDQIAYMFRMMRSILFMCRLCQSEAAEAILLLDGQLDEGRTENLLKIAFSAEAMISADPDGERLRCHPTLLANILREGSWVSDEMTQQLWAGILVSSCAYEEPENTNQALVSLLIHITPAQAKILLYACQKVLSAMPGVENPPVGSVVLNQEEMKRLSDRADVTRSTTDIVYLFHLGLVQREPNLTSFASEEGFDITPTSLGLELYKHCHGERRKLPRHLETAAYTNLRNFLPNMNTEG